MPPVVAEFLEHIIDELNYLAQETTKDRFLNDETLQRSFVRSIEIIGEATKKIPQDIREQFPAIAWKKL